VSVCLYANISPELFVHGTHGRRSVLLQWRCDMICADPLRSTGPWARCDIFVTRFSIFPRDAMLVQYMLWPCVCLFVFLTSRSSCSAEMA